MYTQVPTTAPPVEGASMGFPGSDRPDEGGEIAREVVRVTHFVRRGGGTGQATFALTKATDSHAPGHLWRSAEVWE